jgi:hypothetical protein
MRVGIDASNLLQGGGVTHLVQLLTAADPPASGIDRVIVWGAGDLLDRLPPSSMADGRRGRQGCGRARAAPSGSTAGWLALGSGADRSAVRAGRLVPGSVSARS